MVNKFKNGISPRLDKIASLIRQGSYLIDVGTDHAYLPIFLAQSGRIRGALASDIAPLPLERAKKAIAQASLAKLIKPCLTPGLDGIELQDKSDIVIAGMGGEMIAQILDCAKQRLLPDTRLILQPMTKAEVLRKYLCGNGFDIESEHKVKDGKIYQIIVCKHTAVPYELTPAELEAGRKAVSSFDRDYCEFVSARLFSIKRATAGKAEGGEDISYDIRLTEELSKLLKEAEEKVK